MMKASAAGDDGSQSQQSASAPSSSSSFPDPRGSLDSGEEDEDQGPTELVLTFERRGEGWGEELLPRAQFKRLPISRKDREPPRRASAAAAAEEEEEEEEEKTTTSSSSTSPSARSRASSSSSPRRAPLSSSSKRADVAAAELELLLREPGVAGLTPEEASAVVSAATSWRVTPAGRALRDRASVGRASRRAEAVIAYLQNECGLPPGRDGVGAALHTEPIVHHHENDSRFVMRPGMAFTIEPMVVEGSNEIELWPDGWQEPKPYIRIVPQPKG